MPARLAARRINNAKKIGRRPESRAEQVAVINNHGLTRAEPVKYREVQERGPAVPRLRARPGGSLRTSRNRPTASFATCTRERPGAYDLAADGGGNPRQHQTGHDAGQDRGRLAPGRREGRRALQIPNTTPSSTPEQGGRLEKSVSDRESKIVLDQSLAC